MKFTDLKLRTKQLTGFGIILLIMAADHMFSIRNMRILNNEIDEVSRNWLPRAVAIADINLNTTKLRLSQLQHAYATDQSLKQDQESQVVTLIDKINENLDTYNELKDDAEARRLYSAEEGDLFTSFDDKWDDYQTMSFEIFTLSRENQNDEAVALLNGKAKEVFDDFSSDLVELVESNKQDSFEAAQRAERTYSATHKVMTATYVVTIGLSLVIAFVLVQYITGPVRQLDRAAGRVADGDLDVRLDIASRDEIGSLAGSYNQMTAALRQAKLKTEKQAQALEEQNQELASAMSELRETQEQLLMKEKMAALGDLVAGVAHEINNPIGTVNSSAEVADRCVDKIETLLGDDSVPEDNGAQLKKTLKILRQSNTAIQLAGERISNIVTSLKNFSRLDEAEYQKVDIHAGIESSLTLLGGELQNKISIHKDYCDLPLVACYPSQLNQAFINLFKNAVNAIEGSGCIGVRTFVKSDRVHVEIKDTGRGIPRDRLDKIFDFGFSTGNKRVKMSSGLSTVYNIIQRHNGEIKVESEVGKGTTFTIVLPVE